MSAESDAAAEAATPGGRWVQGKRRYRLTADGAIYVSPERRAAIERLAKRAKPVRIATPRTGQPCGRCGQPCKGLATINGTPYHHGDNHDQQSCYSQQLYDDCFPPSDPPEEPNA